MKRIGFLLALALMALPAVAGEPAGRAWRAPDGSPLPFTDVDEAVAFLAAARVVDVEALSTGITKPKKLLLELNGVRAHAVFHSVERRERRTKRLPNGRFVLHLLDSHKGQAAAFELARELGLDSVPPTVLRRIQGRPGSVQLWIENAITEGKRRDRALEPPDPTVWRQQKADQWVFDNLINNIDRNTGNTLIDGSWNLWLIDHTRAFGQDRELPYPERITSLSTGLWAGLRKLEPARVESLLEPYLAKTEIRALLVRRELLIEALEERIARLGEDRIVREPGRPWISISTTPSR